MFDDYIVLDFETFYSREYSLTRLNTMEYILDRRFRTHGVAVARGDEGAVSFLEELPFIHWLAGLKAEQESGRKIVIVSHNAAFDMSILHWRYGFLPDLMIDTLGMARATIYAYTGTASLANVAKYLGVGLDKGDALLRTIGMSVEEIKAAGLWGMYADYAIGDAAITRLIFRAMRESFPMSEYLTMDAVLRTTVEPRFEVDVATLTQHHHQILQSKETLLDRCGLTDRGNLMSNEKFAQALRDLGVDPPMKVSPTTGALTYAFAKNDADFAALQEHPNPDVQALVAARLGVKSTIEETRTATFIRLANLPSQPGHKSGRIPMPLRYAGAHTHRLSGDWGMNVQNLGRSSPLRKALKAPKGFRVVAADASQIEARITAWLAGQWDLVDAFARKQDIYSDFASKEIYHRPVNKKENPLERFVGKQVILGCFAADTKVLTHNGWKPIVQVRPNDLLWDGVEWVKHDGVIYQGFKETETAHGLTATPDHEILTGHSWQAWSQVHTNPSLFRSALAMAASPSCVSSRTVPPGVRLPVGIRSAAASAVGKVVSTDSRSLLAAARSATGVRRFLPTQNGIGATGTRCRTTRRGLASSTGSLLASLGAMCRPLPLSSIMVGVGSPCVTSGGRTGRRSWPTSRRCLGGMTRFWNWIGSTSTGGTSPATYGSPPVPRTLGTDAVSPSSKPASASSRQKSHVYDVVNAGPRHRFTVLTDHGPIVVHNCGFGVGPPKFQWMVETLSRLQLGEKVVLPIDDATRIVHAYRRRYPKIPQTWNFLGSMLPLMAQGGRDTLGPVTFESGRIIGPEMPGGGHLCLYYPNLQQVASEQGYEWTCTFANRPKRLFGGKLMENIVQFLARLVVFEARRRLALVEPKFKMALTVHDELVYVVPENHAQAWLECMIAAMSTPPEWGTGMPLDAEGDHALSYGECK